MKARVIATGKIVDVVANGNYYDTTDNKERYYSHELDFNDTVDYWTRLEHQAAIAAMQGILSNSNITYKDISNETLCGHWAGNAKLIAHSLVEKYKKEEK